MFSDDVNICFMINTLEHVSFIMIDAETGGQGYYKHTPCDGTSDKVISWVDVMHTAENFCKLPSDPAFTYIYVLNRVEEIYHDAFSDCKYLKRIRLSDSLVDIGNRAFMGCRNLNLIENMPAVVKDIGASAFEDCSSLTRIRMPSGLVLIRPRTFAKSGLEEVIMPSDVRIIDDEAFIDCKKLVTLRLRNVEIIGCSAFRNTGIQILDIPASVVDIGDFAFMNSDVSSLDLRNGLEEIGVSAFENCKNLLQVHIPITVKRIGSRAFANTSLSRVYIPKTCLVEDGAFDEHVIRCQ